MFTSKRFLSSTRQLVSQVNKSTAAVANLRSTMTAPVRMFSAKDNFMSGSNANYVDQMFSNWKADPTSVHPSWQAYFSSETFDSPPTLGKTPQQAQLDEILNLLKSGAGGSTGGLDAVAAQRQAAEAVEISKLCRAFQTHGHLLADLDPLELKKHYANNPSVLFSYKMLTGDLDYVTDFKTYGFTEQDLDKEFYMHSQNKGRIREQQRVWKLKDLIQAYKNAYCGKIGVEFMHITDKKTQDWIRMRFEGIQYEKISQKEQLHLYTRLNWAYQFGNFTAQKFNTMKRFGLEGCESFVPGLKVAIDTCSEMGAQGFVIGMPHRGRLSVLGNVVRKPLEIIFAEFQGVRSIDEQSNLSSHGGGDVKYHLGTTYNSTSKGKEISVTLMANPSHLEAVNPVVMGRVRAEQHFLGGGDENRSKIVPILVHGDAAFAGQGVVFEGLQLQDLRNYKVGGTIHVVINNQVGFTTSPVKARSGHYCTDVAKSIGAPIFHVNADSLEDVAKTFKFAAEYRQKFGKDVVIDLIGYRKMGHNELDQPAFTNPMMYKIVNQMENVRDKYRKHCLASGVQEEDLKKVDDLTWNSMEAAYVASKNLKFAQESWRTQAWEAIKDQATKFGNLKDTGVADLESFRKLAEQITTLPKDEKFHPQIVKVFDARVKSIQTGKGIDWGTAEALAFASLLQEGYHVRLSGQDVERGTFSHRHAHVFYQDKDGYYNPINSAHLGEQNKTRNFIASNSNLSEFAVLGFEYGYACTNPNTLVLWEAQFGDFANGAQIIIDQFIAAGEAKWNVKNGLVMLLPHGYDGGGPEHSSCRVERFLQLSDSVDTPYSAGETAHDVYKDCNMGIVNCSTAAQYFHALRRQMRRPFRKPLVVVAPKKLLKFGGAGSNIEDFAKGTTFKRIIDDDSKDLVAADKIRKVVYCTGQVYYDLIAERQKLGTKDVAIVRVEQLSPWPFNALKDTLQKYKNAEVCWSQEENKNNGVWSFAEPRFRNQLKALQHKQRDISYAGRASNASPATGHGSIHKEQLTGLLADAFK